MSLSYFRTTLISILIVLLLVSSSSTSFGEAPSQLLLILDASGSMWGQVEGKNKIVIARKVLHDLIQGLPEDTRVGLIAYGHRQKSDCEDIETIVPFGTIDKEDMSHRINALNPKGMTPITKAVNQAFDLLSSQKDPITIVLVSDGIETCGGDPCQAVREAKTKGIDFVMHVVGFDMGEVDVSQLECTAQAGQGLFFNAKNADELAAALDYAVAVPAEVPNSQLSIKAEADGALTDVAIRVTRSDTGEEVAVGRTYTSKETNPRILPVPAGTYDIRVQAIGFKGNVQQILKGIEISEGQTVEKNVDFSVGELSVKVTRNGELSDATVNVYSTGPGQRERVAGGRSYTRPQSNPIVLKITPGEYDIIIKSVEISSRPVEEIKSVAVESRKRAERFHDFTSGTLSIKAVMGEELVDATVKVISLDTGKSSGQGRTYTAPKSNPRIFELLPGKYRIKLKAVRLEGKPEKEIEVSVKAGQVNEYSVDFSQ